MRFTPTALLALPLFSTAAQAQFEQFEQYQAQFQSYVDKFSSYIPSPNKQDPADAAEAKTGPKKMSVLTLDNWQQTLYEPVKPEATVPEEWWLLITGRNKTCFGRCDRVDAAWNDTAVKFATMPNSPHMAYLNCDDQPVLCNIFSAGASTLWAIDLLPPGNKIDIWAKRLNATTVTTQDIVDLRKSGNREDFKLVQHVFHPFNSWLAENGLSLVVAYTLWAFATIPNWAFMLFVSLASRRMMNRQMGMNANQPPAH